MAADSDVLDERVLEGLRETYNSLEVPVGPTVRGIQIMKMVVREQVAAAGVMSGNLTDEPFDYMCASLSEQSV